jgi:hypothetical protein
MAHRRPWLHTSMIPMLEVQKPRKIIKHLETKAIWAFLTYETWHGMHIDWTYMVKGTYNYSSKRGLLQKAPYNSTNHRRQPLQTRWPIP